MWLACVTGLFAKVEPLLHEWRGLRKVATDNLKKKLIAIFLENKSTYPNISPSQYETAAKMKSRFLGEMQNG